VPRRPPRTPAGRARPVLEARKLMAGRRIRHLLITESDKLLGIVTDRDIRLSLPSPATSLSVWEINYLVARMTVASVMTTTVITVDPRRDAREAARLMLYHKIGAIPVGAGCTLPGVITSPHLPLPSPTPPHHR